MEEWQGVQDTAAKKWADTKEKIAAGTSTINWDPAVVASVDASFAKISWDTYQQEMASGDRPWTLVHGDLHPANMMLRWGKNGAAPSLVILDWEVVGLGCGPQDLAQYLISHATPELRREIEEQLVREYYAVLTGVDVAHWAGAAEADRHFVDGSVYTWEMCWRDYVQGGSERWVWLFAYLTGLCPDNMNQYFHDQVGAFMRDHGVSAENIGMPRV